MSLKPLLHRIFIQPENPKEADEVIRSAQKAGIVVELDKREKKAVTLGTVLAIGSTAFKEFGSSPEEEGIRVGSRVLYTKYAGVDVPNQEFIVINDEDITGVYLDE